MPPTPFFDVPPPGGRVSAALWTELRVWLLANDKDAPSLLQWANSIARPPDADAFAYEAIWIILCAGKKAQAARTIEKRVLSAIAAGTPVIDAFGHHGRANAIETVWAEREKLFAEFVAVPDEDAVEWCQQLPWVGKITRYQLAKNCGADVCKPDIWLCRLAGIPDIPLGHEDERFAACQALCKPLAAKTGDRVAAVDTLLWLAAQKGYLAVSPAAGPVTFIREKSSHRSMMTAA